MAARGARAQAYPSRPITIIVPTTGQLAVSQVVLMTRVACINRRRPLTLFDSETRVIVPRPRRRRSGTSRIFRRLDAVP